MSSVLPGVDRLELFTAPHIWSCGREQTAGSKLYPRRRDNDYSFSGIQGELVLLCRGEEGQGREEQAWDPVSAFTNEFFSNCLDLLWSNPSLRRP